MFRSRYIELAGRIRRLPFLLSMLSLLMLLLETGVDLKHSTASIINIVYLITITTTIVSILVRYFNKSVRPRWNIVPIDVFLVLFFVHIFLSNIGNAGIFTHELFVFRAELKIAVVLSFLREFSALNIRVQTSSVNPAQLFVLSFLVLIAAGTLLLLLPNATTATIGPVDALFTATSAVCVTGLVVVDTGTAFTLFGQSILLMLIQIGGIGIMTFASYFSFFFKGGSTYEQQIMLREMTNADRLSEVFTILKKIVLITLFIELIGAALIYFLASVSLSDKGYDPVFFSIFHAVSAFCNAGFSTLGDNLYDPHFRFNYPLQLAIAMLIILGGIGFPIVFNLIRYLRIQLQNQLYKLFHIHQRLYFQRILNLNSRIVLITTMLLIVIGTLFFRWSELSNTLITHSDTGKWITAFFSSVTARTAGFNTIDFSEMSVISLLLLMFLMWVGASPGSTGGGIKTSTLAVAVLNVLSIARGKSRIEVNAREISASSVNRAFAVMLLSILVIVIAVLAVSISDSRLPLIKVVFEVVSAYSTVGLSLGITSELSLAGKLILVFTMFIGRVSMLSVLIALLKKKNSELYHFPTESILIN
jgi:potassium uptake TrkH family protein